MKEFIEDFEIWKILCEEAEIIDEAQRSLEDTMTKCFRKDAGFSNETERKNMKHLRKAATCVAL